MFIVFFFLKKTDTWTRQNWQHTKGSKQQKMNNDKLTHLKGVFFLTCSQMSFLCVRVQTKLLPPVFVSLVDRGEPV